MKRWSPHSGTVPHEDTEQIIVCDWLRLHHIPFFSVPNEAALKSARNRFGLMEKLRQMGLMKGAPDLVLIPPAADGRPVVLEMKRGPPKKGTVNDSQREVHDQMRGHLWHVPIGYGADDALRKLVELDIKR